MTARKANEQAPSLAAANTELEAAIRTAQKMLAAYGNPAGFDIGRYAQGYGALAESLRILLRALDAEPADEDMCPACDTTSIERCVACGSCRCDRHDDCVRPEPVTEEEAVRRSGDARTVATTERCARCRWTFDPHDKAFDGRARHRATPFCNRCVDLCRDSEIADHWCPVDDWNDQQPSKRGEDR